MNLSQLFIDPFADDFMRYALASVLFLSVGAAPVGVFLVMRRMSLVGDALGHAVLPGAAVGYIMAGSLSLPAMSLGGFAAGLAMALLAGLVSRYTNLKEDANFAAFYLASLALGVVLVSSYGSNVDLLHLLFGSVLAVDAASLVLVLCVSAVSVLLLAVIYRPLMLESIDPLFLSAVNGRGGLWHVLFLMLVVLNLVAGFQAIGTLMSVGVMMLPAITARLWSRSMGGLIALAVLIALSCSFCGLLFSYHVDIPSGPAIILCLGSVYAVSLFIGREGGMLPKWWRGRHLRA